MNKIELQEELNNDIKVKPVSFYKNLRINSEGSAPTQFNASTQTVLFSIPANTLFNPSKLCLAFRRTGTSFNATTNDTSTVFYMPSDYCNLFSRIECFSSANNTRILDLANADIYSKCAMALNNDYKDNPGSSGFLFPAGRNINPVGSNTIPIPNSVALPNSSLTNASVNKTIQDYALQLYENKVNTALGNIEFGIRNYNIRLGDVYPFTFFNCNRSVYISKNLFIRLTLNPVNKIVGLMKETDNSVSAFSINSNSIINCTNWALNVYSENNPQIIESVINENRKGQTLIIGDVIGSQYTLNGTGSRAIQMRVVNSTGDNKARLYRCYSMLVGSGGDAARALNPSSNYSGGLDGVSGNYANSKFNYASLFVNSQNILNLDVSAKDHVQHMINQHKKHSYNDENYIDDLGVLANVFDTSVNDPEHDKEELKGLDFGLANEINIQWNYNIPGAATNVIQAGGAFTNYQFAEIVRPIYLKDGLIYNSPIF
jgi:hypothetical protein